MSKIYRYICFVFYKKKCKSINNNCNYFSAGTKRNENLPFPRDEYTRRSQLRGHSESNSRWRSRWLIFCGLIPAISDDTTRYTRARARAVCVCKGSTRHAAIRRILAGRSTASSTYRPLDEIERHVECSTSCKRLVEWSVGQYYLESSLTSCESFGPR